MSQEPRILEVLETQRGEWIETKWSDGCITLHRRDAEPNSIQQENASAAPFARSGKASRSNTESI